jgi:hypothetical protein
MADVINLMAEDNRNIIDDDAVPTLTLENTNASGTGAKVNASGGGTGMDLDSTSGIGLDLDTTTGLALDIDSTSGQGIDVVTAGTGAIIKSTATEGRPLQVVHATAVASPTVAPLLVGTSAASGAVFEFDSALISTASLTVAAGAFPVKMTGEDKVVYLVGYEVV